VVIGENVWRTRFAGDPAILGRTIQLGATPHSIVGVMPEGFAFPINHRFWVPLRVGSAPPEPLKGPDIMVFGRLAPGATLESAQAEVAAGGRRTALPFPKVYAQLQARVLPYAYPFLGMHETRDASGLHMMNGIVTMLLVVVCLNVAILVYTRTAMRQAEISVRTALGASRGRIVAQLFIEALVLSAVGAVAGVAIAALALRQIGIATLPIRADLPFWLSFDLSTGAVLYAGVLSVLAATIVGVVPALQATRRAVQSGARISGTGGSGLRLGGTWTALIVAQVGFAVALLPGAGFVAWETLRAEMVDPGIAAEEFLTAQLGMESVDASAAGTREFARRYADRQAELMRRLQADSRIAGGTFALALPGDEPGATIETSGPGDESGRSRHAVRFNRVDVHFFRTLDVPILAGRGFEAGDVEAPEGGAIVVNQSLAQRVFGGDALGRRIRYARQDGEAGPWYEIAGIVRDFPAGVSPGMLGSQLRVYHAAAAGQAQPVNLALRVRGSAPATFSQRLSEVAAGVDPDLQLRRVVSMAEALRKEQWIRLLEASVLAGIALSVLMLSSAGIYALMSFTVSQRRKEIGIRMALGADRTQIVGSIFSRALGQLAAGAALGVAAAAWLERATGDSVMRGNDAVILPAVGLFMMGVGFLAAVGPARRCLRIEPTEALREQ
jgi:predicted permease